MKWEPDNEFYETSRILSQRGWAQGAFTTPEGELCLVEALYLVFALYNTPFNRRMSLVNTLRQSLPDEFRDRGLFSFNDAGMIREANVHRLLRKASKNHEG